MDKKTKNLLALFLVLIVGTCFSVGLVQAQNNQLILETIKECDIQFAGNSCVAELRLINNTNRILDGEAILEIWYQGICGDGYFSGQGIQARFSIDNDNQLTFSNWGQDGAIVSGFEISEGETAPKLAIETHPALCPGKYTITLTLKGTAEADEEYITVPIIMGWGGGLLLPALTIQEESVRVTNIGETSVIITWLTNHLSTSRVIYSAEGEPRTLDLTDTADTPPKYGYARTTAKYNVDRKVTGHSVTITGLTSGTTYYFRAVSHASPPTISREHSFTTLGVKPLPEEEEALEEVGEIGIPERIIEIPERIIDEVRDFIEEIIPPDPAVDPVVDPAVEDEIPFVPEEVELPEERVPGMEIGLVAAIGMVLGEIGESPLLIIILILCLIGLAFVGIKEWKLFKKKKKK